MIRNLLLVAGYFGVMTGWVYWIDAGHGNSWWETLPVAVAQYAIGFAVNRWWGLLLPSPCL